MVLPLKSGFEINSDSVVIVQVKEKELELLQFSYSM